MEAAGKRYVVHPSRSDWFSIVNLSDVHLGNAATAEKKFRADIKAIKDDPYALWLSTGDIAEFIRFDDKRFDPTCMPDWLKARDLSEIGLILAQRFTEIVWPIRDKCLGIGIGNHERRYMLEHDHTHLHRDMCVKLGVPSLGYSALFDVVFVRNPRAKRPRLGAEPKGTGCTRSAFRVYTHHGAGGATTKGGKLNRLTRFMQDFDADLYFMGHVHDQVGTRIQVIGADQSCTKLTNRDKLGMVSGSYLKTYDRGTTTYGEMKGYSPVTLGAAMVRVKPDTRETKGEV